MANFDLTQAAVGYSVATAANEAMGGDLTISPGLEYLSRLRENGVGPRPPPPRWSARRDPDSSTRTSTVQLRDEGIDVEGSSPTRAACSSRTSLVCERRSKLENAERPHDFYFSEAGQQLFARGYMRPVIGSVPEEMASRMLPDDDYARAVTVDYVRQGEVQEDFNAAFVAEVGR